jgi:catechol 2,3-dioxygenase-like lactoylglutathione lyase family enzyme
MFADRHAVFMLPAADVGRAKAWYQNVLGLSPVRTTDFGAVYRLNGAGEMFLYKTEFAGTAQHTLLSFDTDDIESDMAALRAKGVAFIDYDLPGLKTVNGLATFGAVKNAWARDSEGNTIGFVQGAPGS